MSTFHSNVILKARLLQVAEALSVKIAERGRPREGIYWSSRKWCLPGLSCQKMYGCDHRFYADEIGVSPELAYLERAIFINLPTQKAITWWPRFFKAIPAGVELDEAKVVRETAIEILRKLVHFAQSDEQSREMNSILALFEADCKDESDWYYASSHSLNAINTSPEPRGTFSYGRAACDSASSFATAYREPRYLGRAIIQAGYAIRYHSYQFDTAPPGLNERHEPVPAEIAFYERLADSLIEKLEAANPNKSIFGLGRFRKFKLVWG